MQQAQELLYRNYQKLIPRPHMFFLSVKCLEMESAVLAFTCAVKKGTPDPSLAQATVADRRQQIDL